MVGGVSAAQGQTLPLLVPFMTGLLGVSGLVIDMGNAYEQHRQTQAVADAAALVGAARGWSRARTVRATARRPDPAASEEAL